MNRITAKQLRYSMEMTKEKMQYYSNTPQKGPKGKIDMELAIAKQTPYTYQMSESQLSFYKMNCNDQRALLDAVNFFSGAISADVGCGAAGYFHFGNGGKGQEIPKCAIPRIKVSSLKKLRAKGNTLSLDSKNYYAYTGTDGKQYACAFSNNVLKRAFSESVLADDMHNISKECKKDMRAATNILSILARGSDNMWPYKGAQVRKSLSSVGIVPGEFNIEVNGKKRTYYLTERGGVISKERALSAIKTYNNRPWLKTHEPGDKVTIYGKEYEIDEEGYIHVPTENFWENEKCIFKTGDKL